ncbi:hypothetical protein [Poseidonibacter sp.]|uniref:hypothetical protein n=1 Tax=Poseidonibacter sp. TaxID=2321188 RepID=UPI003C741EF3
MGLIKKLITKVFDYFGYTLTKNIYNKPVDIRGLSNNPRALSYFTNTNRQILINTTFDKGRGLEMFSLSPNSHHPFIVAIKYALTTNNYKKALKEKLSQYYSLVQPQSSSEWLGFDKGEVPLLDNEPAWVSLLPWENSSLKNKKNGRNECAIYDNSEHGANLDISEGWRSFGPVSDEVLELEVNRLYKLMNSIKKNGILRDDNFGGDIGAIILLKDETDYRWVVEWGGQHRSAAISAMGYTDISIRVWQVVERKDVSLWPNVQSGLYSKKMALKIFDNIYDGKFTSNITKDWKNNESK